MKIAHICLAGAFTEGMGYQDNFLVEMNREDGHEVLVISDCKRFDGPQIIDTAPEDRVLANGARLVRLPFDRIGPKFLSDKIKRSRDFFSTLAQFSPDVILYHGVIGWELKSLARYKKLFPAVRIYVDSHEDRHNSATNFLSFFLQYRMLTRYLIHNLLPHTEKILYITDETKDFLTDVLDLPDEKLEYFPLGGILVPSGERAAIREVERARLGFSEEDIVFLHSGKMDERKRTRDILSAFKRIGSERARLVLVGSIDKRIASEIDAQISADDRVQFLGWKDRAGLRSMMCMSDVYLQPGGQSASLQQAICCGMPSIVFPHKSHEKIVGQNGIFVRDELEIAMAMERILADPALLDTMSASAYKVAETLLDYRKLAARIYS